MRRALLAVPLVAAAIVGLSGGCTLLVRFEDADGLDAGDQETSLPDRVTPDSGNADGGPAFPPPCDPTFPLSEVKCNASFPRPNCAKNTTIFPSYPAGQSRANDLVTCNGSATPTCVQHCPFGCVSMPTGFPDACDDCNGRADGTYCMKDLRGPDGRNLGLAVDCQGGKTVAGHVCGDNRCATKCPRSDPKPSCCI